MRAQPTQIAIDIIEALREVSETKEQYKKVKFLLGEDTPLTPDSNIDKKEREQRITSALTGLYNMISYDNINSKLFQDIYEAIKLVQLFVSPKMLRDTNLQSSIKAIGDKITNMEQANSIEEKDKVDMLKELVGGLLIKSDSIKSLLPKDMVSSFINQNPEVVSIKKEIEDNLVPIIIGEFKKVVAISKQEEIKKQYAIVKEILGQNSQPIFRIATEEKTKDRYYFEQVDRKNKTIDEFSKLLDFIASDDISTEDFQKAYEAARLIQAFVSPAILEDRNLQNSIKLLGDKIIALENVNPKEVIDYDKILKCRELAGGLLIKSDAIKSILPDDINKVKINLWTLPSREDIANTVYTEEKAKEAIDLLKMKSIDTTSNSNSYEPKTTISEKPAEKESTDIQEVEPSKKGKSKFAAAFEKVKNKFKIAKTTESKPKDDIVDQLVKPTVTTITETKQAKPIINFKPSSKLKRSEGEIDYDAGYQELDKLMGIEPSTSKANPAEKSTFETATTMTETIQEVEPTSKVNPPLGDGSTENDVEFSKPIEDIGVIFDEIELNLDKTTKDTKYVSRSSEKSDEIITEADTMTSSFISGAEKLDESILLTNTSASKVSADIELTPEQLKANKIFAEIDSFIAAGEEFKEISDDGLELMEGFKEEKDIEELDKLLGNGKGSDSKLSSADDDLLQIEEANDFAKEKINSDKEFDDLTRVVSDVSNDLKSDTKESDRTAKANAERKELQREQLRKKPPTRTEAIREGLVATKKNTDGGMML